MYTLFIIALPVLTNLLVKRLGYYLPWGIAGAALGAIGTGLMSTLNPDTSTGKWVGYQILAGVGRGAGQQVVMFCILRIYGFITDCSFSYNTAHHRNSKCRFAC